MGDTIMENTDVLEEQRFCIFINLYFAAVYKCSNVFTN